MEKITIGVPYEISIEPSVDIGKFDAHLLLEADGFNVTIELKKIKGKTIHYTFIVPQSLEKTFENKKTKYKIVVIKDNARFEVDKGDIQFINESNFTVNNLKMIPTEKPKATKEAKPKTTKKTTKKKAPVKKPVPTPKPEEVKESEVVIDEDKLATNRKIEEAIKKSMEKTQKETDVNDESTVEETLEPEDAFTKIKRQAKQNKSLTSKLDEIKKRNQEKQKREEINKKIRESIERNS